MFSCRPISFSQLIKFALQHFILNLIEFVKCKYAFYIKLSLFIIPFQLVKSHVCMLELDI